MDDFLQIWVTKNEAKRVVRADCHTQHVTVVLLLSKWSIFIGLVFFSTLVSLGIVLP